MEAVSMVIEEMDGFVVSTDGEPALLVHLYSPFIRTNASV